MSRELLNAILTSDSKVKVLSGQASQDEDSLLRRHNSLGSAGLLCSRRKCVVTLDGHRYTIGECELQFVQYCIMLVFCCIVSLTGVQLVFCAGGR
ncbi:hypothetical protein PoB_006307600 [Plakobranchus ocellatus]|uniref:Uncharacterized protein n=1 Tax=Plakobranchus ocellatus TaxID=259542 RepID=A0AAV4CXW7_9GAST|nr:hypothetical protein PoB_006307600 [Plakobranchus ocellatus]